MNKKIIMEIIAVVIIIIAVTAIAIHMTKKSNTKTSENTFNSEGEINNDIVTNEGEVNNESVSGTEVVDTGKTLVAYFSLPENNGTEREDSTVTVSTITKKLSGAKVNQNAFKLYRNNMEDAPKEVENWLKEIDIIK